MRPTKSALGHGVGVSLGLGLVLALGLALPAIANDGDNRDKFNMAVDTVLEGVSLPTGSYHVEWTGNGPSVAVTVKKGSRVLLTTEATLTEMAIKSPSDSATIEPTTSGDRVLTAMRFGGKKLELKFADAAAQKKPAAKDAPLKSAAR